MVTGWVKCHKKSSSTNSLAEFHLRTHLKYDRDEAVLKVSMLSLETNLIQEITATAEYAVINKKKRFSKFTAHMTSDSL